MSKRHLVSPALVLALCAVSPVTARAVSPLEAITTSPDVTAVIQGHTVQDENVLDDDLAGSTGVSAIAGIPSSADLVAYAMLPNGEELFSLDTTVSLPGGVTAEPRDVVRFLPAGPTYEIVFDGSAQAVPDGVQIDAVDALDGNFKTLLISFDVTTELPGKVRVDDEDVVFFSAYAQSFTLVFDGSAAGVPEGLDLDGLHELKNGHLLVSFDTSGVVGGVYFDDEDILEWTSGAPGTWEMAYDGSLVDANWAAADLDAVDAAEPADADGDGVIDANDNCTYAANPGQEDTGGVGVGSAPDGIGNACQCGDVSGDGRVTVTDAVVIQRSLLTPPTATQAHPELCNVGGSTPCTVADATIIRRALLLPPTATIAQVCPAALP